jgi:uncharacterized protein
MINPEDLKILAEKSKSSTVKFFSRWKKRPPAGLDDMVHELHEKAFEQINCLECANCCRTLGPRITSRDIEKLAGFLKIRESKFAEKYTRIDEDGDYVFQQLPCPFIDSSNYCLVYEARPKACREYPHTEQRKFHKILDLTVKNTFICPAVYEIVEKLKTLKF